MIKDIKQGDLFESTADTLVNTVNTVGVMGKGIALGFKERFPDMYQDYVRRCDAGEVHLGRPYLWRPLLGPSILNFPTKDHWRSVSRLADIIRGLEHLEAHVVDWEIKSLAVPPLGCGLGELDWSVVGPTLYRYLDRLPIPVELFAPWDVPTGQLDIGYLERAKLVGSEPQAGVEPAWAALAAIAAEVNSQPYAWPVGKTRFQKLAYLATREGLPTGLKFMEGDFGPFAGGLTRISSRLVNNGLVEMEPSGQMIKIIAGPTLDDAREQFEDFFQTHSEVIERVVDLLSRLSGHQTEVASTVLFVSDALRERLGETPTENQVLAEAKRWKARRKPPIRDEVFAESIRDLQALGWMQAEPSNDLPIDDNVLTTA